MKKKTLGTGLIVSVSVVAVLVALFTLNGLWPSSTKEKYDYSEPIHAWQSYSASPVGVHEWKVDASPYSIRREANVSSYFRTGYAFINEGELIFKDKGNGEQFRRIFGSLYIKERGSQISNNRRFRTATHEFFTNYKTSIVQACARFKKSCRGINIKPGTFPYVYAASHGGVLLVTNSGDALLYRDDQWCRMEMEHDVYECRTKNVPLPDQSRKVQFYSSLVYHGRTLVGEWPTGRIYEFDGSKLAPSDMTPPMIAEAGPVGYEAQSLAMYCGDLFVGYWPKGEIYRMDGETKKWSLFASLFEGVSDGDFIPFLNRAMKEGEKEEAAFFGQRVSALVPYEDSLYAVTSNLMSWSKDIHTSVLTDEQIDKYGAVYRIYRQGCRTTYLKN